jgi:hypothetical protein
MEFIKQYWYLIIMSLMLIFYASYLAFNRRWDELRKIAFRLIRQAEKTITGTKMGRERFNHVLDQLYNTLPAWVRFFVPKLTLERKLQEWFEEVKDYLDDGKMNGSVSK